MTTPDCMLWVGAKAGNGYGVRADMRAKGRGNVGLRHGSRTKPERVARGERVGSAKLTADLVRRIRSDRISGGSLSAIATRYGIAFQTVSKIVNRKSWRHIQ